MNRWFRVAGIVLLVGLGLVGLAQVMPADDCTPGYSFTATTTDDPATVDVEELPPEAREAFEQAANGGESDVIPSRVYDDQLRGEVVRYDGENYTTRTKLVGDCGGDGRAFVFVGGSAIAALGVLVAALGVLVTLIEQYT